MSEENTRLRVASVVAWLGAGGIGPVCRYAAESMAQRAGWGMTLLSLNDPAFRAKDEKIGLNVVSLGLDGHYPTRFLQWLRDNPQDLIITSDVSRIEPAFPYIPPETLHVIQIHDSGRRYRQVAIQHASHIDGVVCVARHIEAKLRPSLNEVGFRGIISTVHNGAVFPPLLTRQFHQREVRLLYLGRLEPLKGIFDLVPILRALRHLDVPAHLTIVGGQSPSLKRKFERYKLDQHVTWKGRVPHSKCYLEAAEADVLLMTSRKEPFGMVTIEAMSMGCIPIAYDVPSGSAEIINDGESGILVPLGYTRRIAAEIRQLHLDREKMREISEEASIRARSIFSADVMAGNLIQHIEAVSLNARRSPSLRLAGSPPTGPKDTSRPRKGYQLVPHSARLVARQLIGRSPRLCYWLLNRD